MSLVLVLGNQNYSSWSMRAWLLLRFAEADFEEWLIELYTERSREEVRALGGQTGLVPVLKDGDTTIWDTSAITEYLYERHPRVERDLDRVREIWSRCPAESGGRWLLGGFSAVDIMFAPIATRFQTYGVTVAGDARDLHDRTLDHPLVREWLAAGEAEGSVIERFELPRSSER